MGLKRGQLLRVAKANLSWVSVSSLVVFFCFLMIGSPGFASVSASNIYISQNSAGAANGADCVNAYAYTFFNNSANWGSGAGQIGPGTTVHICGTITGTNGSNILTFQGDGANGSPITLKWETNAIVQSAYCGTGGSACLVIGGRSNVVVDGGTNGILQSTLNGTAGSTCIAGPCQFQIGTNRHIDDNCGSGCSNQEIKNITLLGQYHNDASVNPNDTAGGDNEFNLSGSFTNVSVHDTVSTDSHWTWVFQYGSSSMNLSFYNNTVNRTNHGFTVHGDVNNGTMTTVLFHDNHFHDMFNWDTTSNKYHHDGIHMYTGGGATGTKIFHVYEYNNLFDGCMGAHITAWIYHEGSSDAHIQDTYVFNNLFVACSPSDGSLLNGMMVLTTAEVSSFIANNTMIGGGTGTNVCIDMDRATPQVTYENNEEENCSTLTNFQSLTFATGSPDYNIYAVANNPSNGMKCQGSYYDPVTNFAGWRTCMGNETHSSYNAISGLNISGVPLPGSVVIGAGKNLTSTCNTIPDANAAAACKMSTSAGNSRIPSPRPSTGVWDVGAYVSGLSVTQPAPPTGLTAIVN